MVSPFPRTSLPGLYGAYARDACIGQGHRNRNKVVGTHSPFWQDYLQVVHYTHGRLVGFCKHPSENKVRFPGTYILQRHCCIMADVIRELGQPGHDADASCTSLSGLLSAATALNPRGLQFGIGEVPADAPIVAIVATAWASNDVTVEVEAKSLILTILRWETVSPPPPGACV
jgi:hypothetical protein